MTMSTSPSQVTVPARSGVLTAADRQRLERAREEFAAEGIYLNTATLGLPPRRAWLALQAALRDWRAGTADAMQYDLPLAAARSCYAALVGVDPAAVSVGSQVSVFAGLVAAALPDGSEVLTAAGDFTSILFPFHAQAGRGVYVREVPLDRLADAVTSRTTLVSVSAVQSADGRVADLDELEAACAVHGTRVLLDTTQAVGWLPIDASRFAYTTGGGYKWLLSMRGTAYFTVQPERLDDLVPNNAGWYAGESRWDSIYGAPLRLAADARRFDVSPAWHSWVAAAPALELLADVGVPALHAHAVGLAERFRAATGLPPGDSAIVSAVADARALICWPLRASAAPSAPDGFVWPSTSTTARTTPTEPPKCCAGTCTRSSSGATCALGTRLRGESALTRTLSGHTVSALTKSVGARGGVMWTFEHTETTSATPTQVWARYAEPTTWPEWDHEIAAVTLGGPMAVGTRGTLKPVKGPATPFTFTAVTPEAGFTDVSRLPLARLTFSHHIEAMATGCRFTHSVEISGPLSPVFARIIGKKISAGLPAAMRALARLAETAPAAAR